MLKRTQNLIATLTAVVALLVASAGTFGSALFGGAIFDGINSAFNHGFPNFYGGGGAGVCVCDRWVGDWLRLLWWLWLW